MNGLKAIVDRQLGAIAHARAAGSIPLKAHTSAAAFLGIALQPGARVLDTTSGQEGTVIAATIVHKIVGIPVAADSAPQTSFFNLPSVVNVTVITVKLDDGTLVQRDPKDLIELPPSLNVPAASLAVPQ